jgi:hypothetical protein
MRIDQISSVVRKHIQTTFWELFEEGTAPTGEPVTLKWVAQSCSRMRKQCEAVGQLEGPCWLAEMYLVAAADRWPDSPVLPRLQAVVEEGFHVQLMRDDSGGWHAQRRG